MLGVGVVRGLQMDAVLVESSWLGPGQWLKLKRNLKRKRKGEVEVLFCCKCYWFVVFVTKQLKENLETSSSIKLKK